MAVDAATRLRRESKRIIKLWSMRASREVNAAQQEETLALSPSLPDFLSHLANVLSTSIARTEAREARELSEAARIGKKHGLERAGSRNYTIDQLISEYHILREVICDVLEEEAPLSSTEREIVVCVIERSVKFAATEFSNTLRDIQERLTHTLAHDLRNPISAAKSNAQLILRRPEDVEHSVKAASRISMNMDRLDAMIHDLLDASRIRAGQSLPLQFNDCDLDLIARQIAEEFNFQFPDRIRVVSSGVCIGHWSEHGLRRAIENLVSNAIKYGAAAPVTISLRQTPERAWISVHNEGAPIAAEDEAILFQQFRRIRSSEAKVGWGLGLTLVKGIAEAHRGTVRVVSKGGQGTTFILELPKWARVSADGRRAG